MKILVESYKKITLNEGDVIRVLRANNPELRRGELLVLVKRRRNINWVFKSLSTGKLFGFRLLSIANPKTYNENYGWERVEKTMKKRVYESNLFFVQSEQERVALLDILFNNGYELSSKQYYVSHQWIYTIPEGLILSSLYEPVTGFDKIRDTSWIVPKFEEVATINVNGKTYIRSEYEAMLSKLNPV